MRGLIILFLSCYLSLLFSATSCEAGIRSPGKYSGVVIFDRWDGCTLYSGIYVMYMSEKSKEDIRKYAGQAVQIDAKEVFQPINPGDGRIDQFEYLGSALGDQNQVPLEGIRLETSIKVSEAGKAIAIITIQNKGNETIKLFSQELALTLLTECSAHKHPVMASDGPSIALITRQSFEIGGVDPRWEGKGMKFGKSYYWTIGKENALQHKFTLVPSEKIHIYVQFDLPDGQYDFLCGYGGGTHEFECLASNLSAFDINNGKAKVIKLDNR